MMKPTIEACFEGVICSVCGSEIGENEESVWSDEQEDYICLNCHEEECNEEDEDEDWDDDEDDWDDWDDWDDDECECGDECDRCGKTAPCKEVWGENLCPSCYGDTVDGFLK